MAKVKTKDEELDIVLSRGVIEVISYDALRHLLGQGKPLRLKMGFDPSSTDIHLGHAVGLRKLRQFQKLGHQVHLIVGDWTARIGDPSGRSATRPMLTPEQVYKNAETYLAQFFKIVDKDQTQVVWQSEWFDKFGLERVVGLTGQFTVSQMLAREDFSKRMQAKRPISLTELLYPLLQGYDSIAVMADVEFGGSDQRFNLLVGRELQGSVGQTPQQLVIMPLLLGTDGVNKMSKSLGNYIGINEEPRHMYGKVMSIGDEQILNYFEWLTDISNEDLYEIRQNLESGSVNPMDLKKRLGSEIVAQFHSVEQASLAQNNFEKEIQRRQAPDDMQTVELSEAGSKWLSRILLQANMVNSASEAKRLINQGAVEKNGQKVPSDYKVTDLRNGDIIKVGQRRYLKVRD